MSRLGKKTIRANQRRLEPKVTIPPRWQGKWKQGLAGIGIVVLIGLLLFVGGRALNQALTVTHWQIDASPNMSKRISQVLRNHALDFWHTRAVVLQQKLLQEIPDLAEVKIQRQLPDSLIVQVRLRQAIGLWENDHGVLSLVDEKGKVYRALKQGESVDLPMLRMPKKHLKKVSEILQMLQKSSRKWSALNSEVFTSDLGWKMNFNQGQQWLLPFGSKAVHNVALLSKIVEKPRWREGQWRINTRMSQRWFFRRVKHGEVI